MQTSKIILPVLALIVCLGGNSCQYTETPLTPDAEFTLPADSSVIYRFTKRYFIVVPGDTALFYGSRQCTVSTNGIIDTILSDSAYLRTITYNGEFKSLYDTLHYVYPQVYQVSSTFSDLGSNSITRYFERTDSATIQVAYSDNGLLHYTDKNRQIVMPITLIVGRYGWYETDSTNVPINNKWPTSALIRNPVSVSNGSVLFDGYSVATRVISLPRSGEPRYSVNGVDYENGIEVKTYYIISGEDIRNNLRIRICGTVQITRTYFTDRGMIDQLIITFIQKIFSDGSVEITRERVYVARGPEGAKTYSENDSPWK